ncbi:hypothetical protein H311_02556 [Anncaliia algerae PRA109]|nr:hypothetical protein H311_02556 [Anncaliia algerae PRA109]
MIAAHSRPGTTIHRDKYKIYTILYKIGFVHNSVCYKYSFINKENGAHTQHVESINNSIKNEIKKRRGARKVDQFIF